MTEAHSDPGRIDIQQAILDLQDALDFVNRRMINRTDVVEQIFCAILTGEHALIQSRTGVGKSLMTEQIFRMFEGARYFKVQASKEQQPDTYFGGLDIEELKKGLIIHNTSGSLVESEFGFIDEIFDANDFTLRALLTLLNERELVLGVQRQKAAIHTVVAATNYLRVTEITEALLDRFTYQSVVFPDKDPYDQYRIARQYMQHGGEAVDPPRRISYQTLREVTRICNGTSATHTIDVPDELLYYANLVVRYYEELRNRALASSRNGAPGQRDYYISPRRQVKAFDLLRAIAFMHGRTTVTTADVDKLYVLFTTVGIEEERVIWSKATTALGHQFGASNALEQLRTLLDFKALIDRVKSDPELLHAPITSVEHVPLKRTLREWARDVLGIGDIKADHNRRLMSEYLERFQPATDEIRELRNRLKHDLHVLFSAGISVESPLN